MYKRLHLHNFYTPKLTKFLKLFKMSVDPSTVIKQTFVLVKAVYDRLEAFSENNAFRERIEKHIKKLKNIATDLKELELDELPASCKDTIASFNDSLDICKSTCNTLKGTGGIRKFIQVQGHKKELETLDTELKRATDNLQLVLSQVSVLQNKGLAEAVHKGTEEIKGTAINPRQGVFVPNSKVVGSRPHKIEKTEVTLNESGDLMEVKWTDDKNRKDTINSYEIRYDDENELVVSLGVKECMLPDSDNAFLVTLGPPKIKAGNMYTVQVRGNNGAGPGDWSKETIFRFKTGPPNKPKKPTVTVQSPTEVLLVASRLSQRDENGSCVTRCKVEYAKIDCSDPTWESLETNIKQRAALDVKFKIGTLIPDTTYNFRIKMINDSGESVPSDSREVVTTQLVPGPAQNLHISSKRTDTAIKLRWEEPDVNPQAAHKYKVQMRLKKEIEWTNYETVSDKKSVKVEQLKTDTKYLFRVQSINNKEEGGEWSNEVEAETRFGIFGRTLGTIGAFFGGTVGGPVIGAVGGGALAGVTAGKVPDSKAGQRAAQIGAGAGGAVAGGLVGILGAPVIGVVAAIMANKKLAGKMEDMSPQTSDDENEPTMWTEMVKTSNKMAQKMTQ